MFMVVREDIENLIFKCEKLIDVNTLKAKRNKKEEFIIKKFCRYHANSYLCMQKNTIRHIIRYEEKKSIGSRNTLCLCRIPG